MLGYPRLVFSYFGGCLASKLLLHIAKGGEQNIYHINHNGNDNNKKRKKKNADKNSNINNSNHNHIRGRHAFLTRGFESHGGPTNAKPMLAVRADDVAEKSP